MSWWCDMLPPLAVLLSLRVRQVVEVQEEGGVGEFASVGRQVQKFLGSAGHRTDVHVPHLLGRVQLQQLLLDLQVLLDIPALVFELQDGFGVAVDGGDWGDHTGCEGTPGQTKQRDTKCKNKLFRIITWEIAHLSLTVVHLKCHSDVYLLPFLCPIFWTCLLYIPMYDIVLRKWKTLTGLEVKGRKPLSGFICLLYHSSCLGTHI